MKDFFEALLGWGIVVSTGVIGYRLGKQIGTKEAYECISNDIFEIAKEKDKSNE